MNTLPFCGFVRASEWALVQLQGLWKNTKRWREKQASLELVVSAPLPSLFRPTNLPFLVPELSRVLVRALVLGGFVSTSNPKPIPTVSRLRQESR
jgi:hypothetical protein